MFFFTFYLFIYLFIHLFIYLFIYLFFYLFIYLFIYLNTYLLICLFIYLFIYLFIDLFIYLLTYLLIDWLIDFFTYLFIDLLIYLFTCLFIYLLIYLFIYLLIYLSIYLFTYLFIYLFIYLFTFWNIKVVKISQFPEIYWISSDLKPTRFHEAVIFANYPGNTYFFKLNNRNIRDRFEICSIKKRGQWRCTKVFIVNFGDISPLFQAFLFVLTLNKKCLLTIVSTLVEMQVESVVLFWVLFMGEFIHVASFPNGNAQISAENLCI